MGIFLETEEEKECKRGGWQKEEDEGKSARSILSHIWEALIDHIHVHAMTNK